MNLKATNGVFIGVTVFVTGGVVMLIEVAAARLLTPFFGSSIFVWTAVISVTLLSLALGYFCGGKIADRTPSPHPLYGAILACGAYLFLAFFLKRAVLNLAVQLGLRSGAFLSSATLFAPPLFLLGMVSPLAVKLYTERMEILGSHVGILYALSTVGSFLGTLLTGFVLIPQFGVSKVLLFAADTLVALSLIYFLIIRRANAKWPVLLLLIGANLALSGREGLSSVVINGAHWKELYKVESLYGRLKVVEENGISRYLIMDGTNQGGVNTENGLSINLYTYAVDALADMMRPDMKTALVLGLGPGVLPNAFSKRSISTDVVEIDPKMAELYERYFAKFGARERVNLFIEDGRRFLKDRSGKKYDIVIMDIFLGDNSPWHLLTLEAFEDVKKVLADKGGVVINFIALPKDAGGARIIRSIHKTLKRVFPHAVVFNHSGFLGDGPQNIFFAASLADGVFELKTTMPIIPPAFIEPIEKILLDKAESFEGDAFLLTDDYNPVEFYTAKSREKWRRSIMALPAKDIMLN